MLINPEDVRAEWANRIARQSKEMVIIASATKNKDMREELIGYADRLNEQLARIKALPAC